MNGCGHVMLFFFIMQYLVKLKIEDEQYMYAYSNYYLLLSLNEKNFTIRNVKKHLIEILWNGQVL